MVTPRMTLARVICEILKTRVIFKIEYFLDFSIQQPEITHFHTPGLLSFDSVIYNANGRRVVDTDSGGWLQVPEFLKHEARYFGLLCI
jgi:hypothetical protein